MSTLWQRKQPLLAEVVEPAQSVGAGRGSSPARPVRNCVSRPARPTAPARRGVLRPIRRLGAALAAAVLAGWLRVLTWAYSRVRPRRAGPVLELEPPLNPVACGDDEREPRLTSVAVGGDERERPGDHSDPGALRTPHLTPHHGRAGRPADRCRRAGQARDTRKGFHGRDGSGGPGSLRGTGPPDGTGARRGRAGPGRRRRGRAGRPQAPEARFPRWAQPPPARVVRSGVRRGGS